MVHKRSKKKMLQDDINNLLFNGIGGNQKKLLTIIIKRDKHKKFSFLKAETDIKAVGTWNQYHHERNTKIEIEFKDKNNKATKKLLPKLEQYNKVAVKEDKLYARVTPVSASTL